MLGAVAVKALALVGAGVVAAWALRRSSAASRHLLWTAVLASVLVIAFTAPLPPRWPVPLGIALAPAAASMTGVTQGDAARGSERPLLAAVERSMTDAPLLDPPAWAGGVLVLLWVAGVAFFVLRMAVGSVALRRLALRARAIEAGPARDLFRGMSRDSASLERVRLIESDALRVPAAWGMLRPVVALPVEARDWPAARLEATLRHEAAHVQRGDLITQKGADLCCALLWFHPAVWFAARRMRWERERACDDAVLAGAGPDLDYAGTLLALAETLSRHGPGQAPAAVGLGEWQGLEERLRAILDPATVRSSPRSLMASIASGALIAAVALAGLGLDAPAHAGPQAGARHVPAGEFLDERLPLPAGQERWALSRRFRPRDEREAWAFGRLREAADHERRHPLDLVRERAVWALSIARDEEVVPPLVERLSDADWRARAYAAWCLGLVGAARAREELTAALRDPVWRVRAMAATALAGLGHPASAGEMLALLDDPAWQVRLPAVEYLSGVETSEAREAVRRRLDDPHIAVRQAARAAVEDSGTP
jgi:beta-lactamase regulating signal transducer with metallopeptidase domain